MPQPPDRPAPPSVSVPAEKGPRRASGRKALRRARVPLGAASTAVFLALARPTWGSLLIALPPVVAGVWLRGYASGYLSKNRELAVSGPYAHTRNPLYLGSALIGVGFAIAGGRWEIAVGLAALFAAVYAPTILGEERFLRSRFPNFDDYARAVPRLLPRPTPARLEGGGGGFSRALYLKHKEHNAILGALATYAALVARILLKNPG